MLLAKEKDTQIIIGCWSTNIRASISENTSTKTPAK